MMRLPVIPAPGRLVPGGSSQRGSHRLALVSQCRRKWWWRYGYRTAWMRADQPADDRRGITLNVGEADYLTLGTLFHLFVSTEFGKRLDPRPYWADDEVMRATMLARCAGRPDLVRQAIDAGRAFIARGEADRWTPFCVEHEFKATLGEMRQRVEGAAWQPREDDWQIVTSRIDFGIGVPDPEKYGEARLYLVDTKTTSRGGIANGQRLGNYNPVTGEWALSWQFSLQMHVVSTDIALRYGPWQLAGNLVLRAKVKAEYDFRPEVVVQPRHIIQETLELAAQQCATESQVVDAAQAAQARGEDMTTWVPQGSFWNCYAGGRACEYRTLCLTDNPETRKQMIAQEYRAVGEGD